MQTFIITGASRGVGAALVRELMRPGHSLFCVSRSLSDELIAESNDAGVELHWIQADLAETRSLDAFMATIAERVASEGSDAITLINNAAVLSPVGLIGSASADEIAEAVSVNLVAPMVLTHSFVRHFGAAACPRTVINVSSGAGASPMPGLSTYSTTKAALNAFTRACAGEPVPGSPGAGDPGPAPPIRFYAVSPGTADTSMQEELRAANPTVLPDHETYVEWKRSGSLVSPRASARAILSLLARDDVANGSFIHYQDLTETNQ